MAQGSAKRRPRALPEHQDRHSASPEATVEGGFSFMSPSAAGVQLIQTMTGRKLATEGNPRAEELSEEAVSEGTRPGPPSTAASSLRTRWAPGPRRGSHSRRGERCCDTLERTLSQRQSLARKPRHRHSRRMAKELEGPPETSRPCSLWGCGHTLHHTPSFNPPHDGLEKLEATENRLGGGCAGSPTDF